VAGNYMFQHATSFEVSYLAKKLLDNGTGAINYGMMPHAVFSEPEVAGIGETEQSLESKNIDYIKVVEPWSGSARALAMKVGYPRTDLLVSRQGALLGCHLIGPQATTLLHEVLPVMQIKNDVRVLADTIHVHPGLSEVILEAARRATELLGDGQHISD
jgi:mycothione reductase